MLFVLGACFGSFLCCQARRLHLKEKQSKKRLGKRSICFSCGKKISWFDNLPILSWLFLRGKCRHCRAKIGLLEFLVEIAVALAFLFVGLNFNSASTDPLAWTELITTLALTVLLAFLAIYDAAYGELPTFALILSIIFAALLLALKQIITFQISGWSPDLVLNPIFAVLILAGTYLTLYLISKGNWVGDGDWLLSLALALALAQPWLALLTLCLANLLACLTMVPLIYHQKSRQTPQISRAHIPLGPFLVTAFVVIYSAQDFFLNLL